MAPDKSLAAEIEAVLQKQWDKWGGTLVGRSAIPEIAAEIVTQSRAFEDGARWMRERAKIACLDYCDACREHSETHIKGRILPKAEEAMGWAKATLECAHMVSALPLQPEGERNV